jgi:peptidoglycan/LPS O-acetylase OafA/YrhL
VSLTQRNQSLDVLRCIAVVLVLGAHIPYYRFWTQIGWAGVDLFFVLSGFLISGLLFKDHELHGSIDWQRFLVRRGFKIYPSFYLLLAVTAIAFEMGHVANLGHILRMNAVFVSNYFPEALPGAFGHIWSLAVEEHFYLLLPGVLMVLAKRRSSDPFGPIVLIFGIVAVACGVLRYFAVGNTGGFAIGTHMRIDSLFVGVALRYIYLFRPGWFAKLTKHWALPAAAILCSPAVFLMHGSRIMQTFGLTSLFLGFALLVSWSVVRTPKSRTGIAITRAMAALGFYSYSIYLWHALVAVFFAQWDSALGFWAYVAASLLTGILMAKLIELPALALRDRLFPARQRLAKAAPRPYLAAVTNTSAP